MITPGYHEFHTIPCALWDTQSVPCFDLMNIIFDSACQILCFLSVISASLQPPLLSPCLSLQCIAFNSIFMQYTKAHTVLCIVPINTLQNWLAEYDMWCLEPRHFSIFVLNDMHKTTASRAKVIGESHCTNHDVTVMSFTFKIKHLDLCLMVGVKRLTFSFWVFYQWTLTS